VDRRFTSVVRPVPPRPLSFWGPFVPLRNEIGPGRFWPYLARTATWKWKMGDFLERSLGVSDKEEIEEALARRNAKGEVSLSSCSLSCFQYRRGVLPNG